MKNRFWRSGIVFTIMILFVGASIIPTISGLATSKTYTLDADFDLGVMVGVEHDTVHDQLQLSEESGTLPFIWVPNSNEGTVSKYDTVTGNELGRYWTGPTTGGSPSRTTVDLEGNCWVGNRATGTVVKIGLFEAGNWVDKNSNTVPDTSTDLNGDTDITNAAGTEILPWNTDECLLYEVYVGGGPRGLAVDANNDLWVGTLNLGGGNKFFHIDGSTGTIIVADTINLYNPDPHYNYRSYGAVIDENGYLWSSSLSNYVLKIDTGTKTITPVYFNSPNYMVSYGITVDGSGHVFVASWGQDLIAKIDINTLAVTYGTQHCSHGRGIAVTSDGDVWVIDSLGTAVNRFDNNLVFKTAIDIGSTSYSTGVAVDAAGKVWTCNYGDGFIHRIDTTIGTGGNGAIDLSKHTPGNTGAAGTHGMHYSYSDMTGIIAWSITTKIGTWTVDFDSELADAPWGKVSWNSYEPTGTSVTVKVRSSNDKSSWSGWEIATTGVDLTSTPDGRYLQIEAKLQITSGDVSPILYDLTVETGIIPVDIDIKPGSYPNSINPKSKGNVPVAILTTDDFDASTVDPDTVVFLDAVPIQWAMDDVDFDGDLDLIFHFKTQELDFDLLVDEGGDYPYAYITGETYDGQLFEGKDTVRLVGKLFEIFEQLSDRFPILRQLLGL